MNKKRYKAYLIFFLVLFFGIMQNLWSQPPESSSYAIQWEDFDFKADAFSSFFPENYKPNYQLVGFQGYDEAYTIRLRTNSTAIVPVDLTGGRRALYGTDSYDFPFFRVSLEEMTEANYAKNKSVYLQNLIYTKETTSSNEELQIYKGYEYHLISRKDLSFAGLKGHSTAAVANVYIPEQKVIISLFFFNTKYHSDESPLVDAEDIIKQLIDFIY